MKDPVQVATADGPNVDAFGNLRVVEPQGLFDSQFTYNLMPLQFEQVVSGSGAAITHDATNRCANMAFSATPNGGRAFMQSYEHVRYQPGRSQKLSVTFNMQGGTENVVKFAGLSDGVNGVEFRMNGTQAQLVLLSGTDAGNQVVNQADWNWDDLDGKGTLYGKPSGVNIDFTKAQIFVVDLQALYVGRVRCGFSIDGNLYYVHAFNNANRVAVPYIQTATLPVRCGMTCSGTATSSMRFICSAVISEGGQEENGGVPGAIEGTVTAASGVDTHILSVRPKALFNGIVNRAKILPDSLELLVTGNSPVIWKLVIGQALSGTTAFADVNTSFSVCEFNTAGTASGAPVLVMQQGYCPASASTKGSTNPKIVNRIPITLNAAGAARADGTLSVLVQGVGGTSACRATLNWRELR